MPKSERRQSEDARGGRQPRYAKLIYRGFLEFYAVARLPSSRLVEVKLG